MSVDKCFMDYVGSKFVRKEPYLSNLRFLAPLLEKWRRALRDGYHLRDLDCGARYWYLRYLEERDS